MAAARWHSRTATSWVSLLNRAGGCCRLSVGRFYGLCMNTSVPTATVEAESPVAGVGQFLRFDGSPFQLYQPYMPAGDQPQAIDQLIEGIADGLSFQTLLG